MSNKNLRRGGYIAPYSSSPNSSEYMLNSKIDTGAMESIDYSKNIAASPEIYVPPTASPAVVSTATPGIQGGSNKKLSRNDKMELQDTFYYSLEGGCACNSGGSKYGGNSVKKGGDIILTPFISALALLGARMLADKNSGFNMQELFQDEKKETIGGANCKYRRGGSSCAANRY
jgi:hypothetical protein